MQRFDPGPCSTIPLRPPGHPSRAPKARSLTDAHRLRRYAALFAGLIANICIETAARCAAEPGYHVTLVRDATAAMSAEAMHAAHEINGPACAQAIPSTAELVQKRAPDGAGRA